MIRQQTGLLQALHSKRDVYGNCYWAMRFTDLATGKVIEATTTGGEGNIYGLLYHWNVPNDWDRSVIFRVEEFPIRAFDRLTAKWPHAGCDPEKLAAYIRRALAEKE